MSSIYRKGRDGYFYYQTYVYNAESGKKDKRVYHALGTKDRDDAKTRQQEFDEKYNQKNYLVRKKQGTMNKIQYKRSILFIIPIVAVCVSFILKKKPIGISDINNKSSLPKNNLIEENNSKNKSSENDVLTQVQDVNQTVKNNLQSLKINSIQSRKIPKLTVPDYEIVRIEKLSDSFKQLKLYVTVDKNTSDESQRLICNNLLKVYNEFSNFIICLYSDDDYGNNIANGAQGTFAIENLKDSWLAMYTYNSVEGEYFDPNPNNYLGTN